MGFETKIKAGPNPWKKAENPSVLIMLRIVSIRLGFLSVVGLPPAVGKVEARVVRTVCRV